MIPAGVIEVRRDICGDCPAQCAAFLEGRIRHEEACAACPVGRWPQYDVCKEVVPPSPAPAVGSGLPSLPRMAVNFAKAVGRNAVAILTGKPKLELTEPERRRAICLKCPSGLYVEDAAGNGRCRHAACGCYLQKKTAWRAEKCPAGHW